MAVATLVASSTREIHGSGAFPLLPVIHLNLSHSLLTYIRRRSPYGVPLFDRATVHAYALVQLQSRAAARRQRQPKEYQQSGTTYGRHGAIVNCTEYDVPGRYEHEYPCVFDDVAPAEVWLTHLSIPRTLPADVYRTRTVTVSMITDSPSRNAPHFLSR
jgi:hypothetical protein